MSPEGGCPTLYGMEMLNDSALDPLLQRSLRRSELEDRPGAPLDADALCTLLLRLDEALLPQGQVLFQGLGPSVTPLFRGLGAELLLVRWRAGQHTPVEELGDSALAIRPLSGGLELQSYVPVGRRVAELRASLSIRPGQLAGVPRGAVHALVAVEASVSLHLCSPPVVVRTRFQPLSS